MNPDLYRQKRIEFLEGLARDRAQHLRRSLEHISKGRKKQVVVFIDNADQRQDDIQQSAFLIAQEMAEHWPAAVFITLRPETFHRSLRLGALSGYHPKAFTISPPRIDQVLNKRLKFALQITSGRIAIHGLKQVSVKLEKLGAILHALIASINRNDDLLEFIDNVCGGNVRVALDLVRNFLGSGHVNTQKIHDIYNETGSYTIPLHEFLRAVMFGDYDHYDPNRSLIANLFDVYYSDPKEHFLLPIILGVLSSSVSGGTDAGFVETSRLYEHAQGFGFTPEQIDAAIVRAYRHKLAESAARRVASSDQPIPKMLRITTVGMYHVNRLCRQFAYLDAMIVDTPIFDFDDRKSIENTQMIAERLNRAECFRKYLDKQWLLLPPRDTMFSWPNVSRSLADQIKYIRERVENNRFSMD